MTIEFEKEYLIELYKTGKTSDKKHRFKPQVINGYLKCIKALEFASCMEDLYPLNSLHYERLRGDKEGLSSLRINDQYRLEFREIPNDKNKLKIEICSLIEISNHYK